MDLQSGFWQVPIEENSRDKTAFQTPMGLYRWRAVPMGLLNASATFQSLMNTVLEGLSHSRCYIDDSVTASMTFRDHMRDLEEVLLRFRRYRLTVSGAKCEWCRSEIKFLGYEVSGDGVRPDRGKVRVVADFPTPHNRLGVQRFLGLVNYYRRFVPRLAMVAQPLFRMLPKSSQEK